MPTSPESKKQFAGRLIVAATIGNALEFYDFITYGFFAIQIAHAFFPATNAYASLMLSLATFGAGFVTRPIGGLVIGSFADRVGRRPAMILSFLLMGSAIVALAVIPSYATIGLAAPVLAVIARMVQGFALGGEVGPTTAFLLEAAPPDRRGYFTSWQQGSQAIASVTASVVGLVLSSTLSAHALDTYGWRIALLLGAVTLPFGLWVRSRLPETIHAPDVHTVGRSKDAGFLVVLQDNWRILLIAFAVITGGTVSTYIRNYLVTFTQATLHWSPQIAFAASVLRESTLLVAVLLGGWLSDRIGRRPLLLWPQVAALAACYPVFYWIVELRSITGLFVGFAILTAFQSLSFGAFYAAFGESLPKSIRSGAIGTIYASAVALFGGTTQLVATWLLHVTGNPMALAWYLIAASSIGVTAMIFITESAPVRAALPDAVAEAA